MHIANIHVKHRNSRCGFAHPLRARHNVTMNLSNLRKLRGINQTELADMIGATQPTISRLERGDDGCTIGQYKRCAEVLGVQLADLFTDDRTRAENELLDLFRKQPQARRDGWLDMARLTLQRQPE